MTLAREYLQAALLAAPFYCVGMAGFAALSAAGDTVTPLKIGALVNVVHVGINWVLIDGHAGFPALGVRGAGISTSFSYAAEALLTVLAPSRTHGAATLRPFDSAVPRDAPIARRCGPLPALAPRHAGAHRLPRRLHDVRLDDRAARRRSHGVQPGPDRHRGHLVHDGGRLRHGVRSAGRTRARRRPRGPCCVGRLGDDLAGGGDALDLRRRLLLVPSSAARAGDPQGRSAGRGGQRADRRRAGPTVHGHRRDPRSVAVRGAGGDGRIALRASVLGASVAASVLGASVLGASVLGASVPASVLGASVLASASPVSTPPSETGHVSGSQFQRNVCVLHRVGLVVHEPVPSSYWHQPQPERGVHVPQEVAAEQAGGGSLYPGLLPRWSSGEHPTVSAANAATAETASDLMGTQCSALPVPGQRLRSARSSSRTPRA